MKILVLTNEEKELFKWAIQNALLHCFENKLNSPLIAKLKRILAKLY